MESQARSVITAAPPPVVPVQSRRRTVTAIAIGNLLEWYDFAVYASLASVIGALFFPSQDGLVSLLATFSVFAVGYAARPIGAAIFGRMADRTGRRRTLVVVIVLMGASTLLIGVLPTYASIGVLAPILLVLARLAQGLSVGGEFSASTSFLVEIAPRHRRGLYGSVAYLTACLGFAMGLAVVFLLNSVLAEGALEEWAWRVPFLLSVPILLVGAYLRNRTHETPAFTALVEAGQVDQAPLTTAFSQQWLTMTRLVGVAIAFCVSSYTVLAFTLSYLLVVREEEPQTAYASVLVAIIIGSLACPLFGAWSDRVGRKPLLVGACLALVVLAVPAYLLMSGGGFLGVTIGQLLLWLPASIFCGVSPAAYSEMFPTTIRSTGVGISYSVATAVFSGTTPLISTLLIERTGSVVSPAWYLMAAGVVSGVVILGLRETARAELL